MAAAKRRRARRQIEGLSKVEAEAIIADIDGKDGNPKKGTFGAGAKHLEAACDAWLASDQSAPPPPGITQTWTRPEEKHDEPGNFAVTLRPEHADSTHPNRVIGRTIGGVVITPARVVARAPGWRKPDVGA